MSERTLRLISTNAAADMLGVSLRTIERLKSEGRFGFPKPQKINGTNYYRPEEIEAFKGQVEKIRRRLQPLEVLLEA